MRFHYRRTFIAAAVLCLLALQSTSVAAATSSDAGATRQIVPVPFNDTAPVNAAVMLDQRQPRIGSMVAICFQVSRAGFASLWNVSTQGQVSRIFPNTLQGGDPGTRGIRQLPGQLTASAVEANRRQCAGVSGDPFRFRVDGPPGTEDLYLLWTARPELQPTGGPYADAAALVADMQRLAAANPAEWAAGKVTYDIIPATGPVTPPLPPQENSGAAPAPTPAEPSQLAARAKVLVLAMGANVDPLTKTNQDAQAFTRAIVQLFNVKNEDARFVANATSTDFHSGMEWLRQRAGPDDYVVIYFSGHGGRFKSPSSDDGVDEFLVPYDLETDPQHWQQHIVTSQLFAEWINQLPTPHVIAVIDACHSAGVFRSLEADVLGARKKYYAIPGATDDQIAAAAAELVRADRPATRAAGGLNRIRANGILLAAAQREQSALEGPSGGMFTVALIEQMMSKEGGTLADVFERARRATDRSSHHRQTPVAIGDATTARQVIFTP